MTEPNSILNELKFYGLVILVTVIHIYGVMEFEKFILHQYNDSNTDHETLPSTEDVQIKEQIHSNEKPPTEPQPNSNSHPIDDKEYLQQLKAQIKASIGMETIPPGVTVVYAYVEDHKWVQYLQTAFFMLPLIFGFPTLIHTLVRGHFNF